MDKIEKIKNLIDNSGLTQYKEKIKDLILCSVRMKTVKKQEDYIPVGSSKIGGRPDLPPKIKWFEYDKRPLAFIAQINIKEVKEWDYENILPTGGFLYFFYDGEQSSWGLDPKDKESFRVFYYDGDIKNLSRRPYPPQLPHYSRFFPCSLEFTPQWTLPDFSSWEIQQLNLRSKYAKVMESLTPTFPAKQYKDGDANFMAWLSHFRTSMDFIRDEDPPIPSIPKPDSENLPPLRPEDQPLRQNREEEKRNEEDEVDTYIRLRERVQSLYEEGYIHRLLGYPDIIQNDMKPECQLVTNGLYCGDESGYNDPLVQELEKGIEDWILLLQTDSDHNPEMMWGDSGRLYFWIKKDDLKNKKFENTWMILQSY